MGLLRLSPGRAIALLLASLLAAGLAQAGEVAVLVTDANGAPLVNAVVYAESGTRPPPPSASVVDIQQRQRRFLPLVTVVQAGSSINFPNNDTVRHHVYSFSPAKTFELKLYSGVPTAPVLFDKPGTVVLGCNIHDQMLAFVLVVDSAYFGKTDDKGQLSLKLPDGKYQLKTWHYALVRENVPVEQAISVSGRQELEVKLDIKAAAVVKN